MSWYRSHKALHDAGGALIGLFVLGLPVGFAFDFVWNLLVLSVTLYVISKYVVSRLTPGPAEAFCDYPVLHIGWSRKLIFCFWATLVGFVVDLGYLFWWFPRTSVSIPLALATIWMPMFPIAIFNFLFAWGYLRLPWRQAAYVGAAMGIFTAPWLMFLFPQVFR